MQNTSAAIDHELVLNYASTKSDEFITQLYERHAVEMAGYIRRVYSSLASDAEDLVQTTFVNLACRISEFDPSRSAQMWIYKMCCCYCIDEIRRRERQAEPSDMPFDEVAEKSDGESVFTEDLDVYLDRISRKDDRDAVVSYYLHSMPLTEVASLLGTTVPTASRRIRRGVATMKASLRAA